MEVAYGATMCLQSVFVIMAFGSYMLCGKS